MRAERIGSERVGFVHLRGVNVRAQRYGGQVAATADLIMSAGCLDDFRNWIIRAA